MALRLHGIEHLSQIQLAILETNGQISVYFYQDKQVRPGLSVLPVSDKLRFATVPVIAVAK